VTPIEVTRPQIEAAARRIQGMVRRTPVMEVEPGLHLKLDLLQPTGSFKVRGAFSLLTSQPGLKRVVAASGGNFGSAVAYAGSRLGISVDVFIPSTSPATKVERVRQWGATVHIVEGYYAEALTAAREYLAQTDALEAHAYDHPEVVAGQGTCGLEILQQVPGVEHIVVAVGGAGLIGGIASWVRQDARLVAVETEGTASLHAALEAGTRIPVEVGGLAADSLGAAQVGEIGYEAAKRWVDETVQVTDEAVREAQHWLWDSCRLVVEPGGAAALAAVRSGRFAPAHGESVCVLVCGANTDPATVT
jgi:threonine dehydratase